MEIGLVSCSNSKLDKVAKPKDLYIESTYFSFMRAYVEKHHDAWYIMSAKHHLLDPDGPQIEPYDKTLRDFSTEEKKQWSQTVFDQLRQNELLGHTLVIHAGKDYYAYLVPLLEENGTEYELPLEGLPIGKRMAWYKEHQ